VPTPPFTDVNVIDFVKVGINLYQPTYIDPYISVGIATGFGLDGRGSISGEDKIFFSPQCPDRFWGPLRVPGALPPG
jgi:hypothetical protein